MAKPKESRDVHQGPQEWNAVEFAQQVAQAKGKGDFGRLKELLVRVAESNYQLRTQWAVPRTVPISHSECISQGHAIQISAGGGSGRGRGPVPPTISMSTLSTADAAARLAQSKKHVVCALNFANGKDVGGGYKNGATAQEEDLCRRIPALYTSLHRARQAGFYPFGPSTCHSSEEPGSYADVLYTMNLTLARDGEEEGYALLPKDKQVLVSLVSAAAPNLRFAKDINDSRLLYRAVQSIFLAPKVAQPDVTALVLGAWGCGAFGGNAAEIAALFAQAIVQDNLGQLYREVHFAVPRTSPSDVNHDTFREVLLQHHIVVRDLDSAP